MGKKCAICGKYTMFYVWTTSAIFPREKYPGYEEMSDIQKLFLKRSGYPVCLHCYKKLLESE